MVTWLLLACRGDPERPDPAGAPTDTAGTGSDDAPAPDPATRLRFVHVAGDAGAVDVRVDGEDPPVLAGVAPPAGTSFAELPAGDHRISVSPAGRSGRSASVDGTLRAGARTAAVLYGLPDGPGLVLLDEGLDDVPLGRARYTLFHAAPELGPVDAITPLATVPATLGERADLGVGDGAAVSFGLDLDRDGATDCTVEVPGVGPDARAALYLVVRDGQARVYGQPPSGPLGPMTTTPAACPVPGPGDSAAGGSGGSPGDSGPAGDTGLPDPDSGGGGGSGG